LPVQLIYYNFVSQSTFNMEISQKPIEQLTEIRNMMERSSRFISLSGLSGVAAGIFALAGAGIAFFYLGYDHGHIRTVSYLSERVYSRLTDSLQFIILDALIVLFLACAAAIFFTSRKARKKGLKIWDATARRMVINLMIPLASGGIYCLFLIYHHLVFLLAPATLLFYGLALLNAGKYTYHEIRVLGISEIILGLMASWLIGYGLLFWAIGFGVMHIFYGLMMYFRYETEVKSDQ
jgi:hypothetical protein